MLQNLEQHPQAAQSFYQTYFTDILMQIFSVVTDTSHTASLQNHATILAYMFSLVEAGRITVSLGPSADNVLNVQEYVATLLKSAFNHLTDNQIKIFVTGLFNLDQDVHAFKEHLRDFLIQIKVGSASACYVECRWIKAIFSGGHGRGRLRPVPGGARERAEEGAGGEATSSDDGAWYD